MEPKSSNLLKYKSKNSFKRFLLKRFLKRLDELFSSVSPKAVLDAGCGEGFTIKFLKLFKSLKYYGIDLSREAIKEAKRRIPFAELKVASIYNIPYPSSFFDLVICSEVLEHLEEPERALWELGRVSKKYLLLTVPNEPWFSISSFFSGQYLNRLGKHPEHVQYWGKKQFIQFVGTYFSIVKATTSFPWTLVLCQKVTVDN